MTAILIQLPSVQVDSAFEDVLDSTAGIVTSANTETFALSDGEELSVSVDGGPAQTITFNTVDFVAIGEATAAEVAAVLNASLVGGEAAAIGGAVAIGTDTFGPTGSIEVTGGTANVALAFPGGAVVGTDVTDQRVIVNRIPEPDETGVALASAVQFDLFDTDGVAPDLTDTDVYIDGILAVDAGVYQSGYTGSTSTIDTAVRRVVVQPDLPFTSDSVVTVRVVSGALDTTYTFNTVDLTLPTVVGAAARDKNVVRVTFAEPVTMVSASGAGDALNPANYSIVRDPSVISVEVSVVGVEAVDASNVDLTTDIELTFGATYTAVASAVTDLAGNPMDGAPLDRWTFTAFTPELPEGRRFLIWDWIPEFNRAQDDTGDLRRFIAVIQEVTNVILCEIDRLANTIDPDLASEQFVDAMLADLGNPFDLDLTIQSKRALVGALIEIYQSKGTAVGIINAIRFLLGIDVTINTFNDEGWELGVDELGFDSLLGPGTSRLLYSFEIVSPVSLTADQIQQITDVAKLMKPAHTHLIRVRVPDDPDPGTLVLDHAELGYSALGDSFVLH